MKEIKLIGHVMTFLKRVSFFLSAMLLVNVAHANDDPEQDAKNIDDALTALQAGNFNVTIEKTNLVINRFEDGKDPASDYVCTNGVSDTLAALLVGQSDLAKGTAKKDKTVAISSNICDAYFLKGFALIDLKRRDEARPYLETAINLDPDNQHYMNELAEWYKAAGQWQKSLELFTKASETSDLAVELMEDKKASKRTADSRQCRSYRGIAFNQVELQNWKEAREAVKKCLAIIPDEPHSKSELEYIEANIGK